MKADDEFEAATTKLEFEVHQTGTTMTRPGLEADETRTTTTRPGLEADETGTTTATLGTTMIHPIPGAMSIVLMRTLLTMMEELSFRLQLASPRARRKGPERNQQTFWNPSADGRSPKSCKIPEGRADDPPVATP